MPTARADQPPDWRESRRLQAWELHQQGWSQRRIAEALGVTQGAVSQWLKQAREGGAGALRHNPATGRRTMRAALDKIAALDGQDALTFAWVLPRYRHTHPPFFHPLAEKTSTNLCVMRAASGSRHTFTFARWLETTTVCPKVSPSAVMTSRWSG